jgi:hypothetical protein
MATDEPGLTERQRKWFASVREGLQRDTGRSLEEWARIARTCPHDKPKARVDWLRETHGLGVNRAAAVLATAFPSTMGWEQPDVLRSTLWNDPASAAIFLAFEKLAMTLPEVVEGQRKAFTAFSRKVQFAAIRPAPGGLVVAGFAVEPSADPRLVQRGNEGWGDRLKGQLTLSSPAEADASIGALLQAAWDASGGVVSSPS